MIVLETVIEKWTEQGGSGITRQPGAREAPGRRWHLGDGVETWEE